MSYGISIDEYRNRMMKLAEETIPKESKKILAAETRKLRRRFISYSKQNVPVSRIDENDGSEGGNIHKKYHTHFKVGKTYRYNEALSKRVFNNSGHGKYVESGRKIAKGYKKKDGYKNAPEIGHTKAYNVYRNVKAEFDSVYKHDLEAWIDKMVNEGKL